MANAASTLPSLPILKAAFDLADIEYETQGQTIYAERVGCTLEITRYPNGRLDVASTYADSRGDDEQLGGLTVRETLMFAKQWLNTLST